MKTIDEHAIQSLEDIYRDASRDWFVREFGSVDDGRRIRGVFTASLTVWLTLVARLSSRHRLIDALHGLHHGACDGHLEEQGRASKQSRVRDVSMNTGGLSRAQARLDAEQTDALADFINEHLLEVASKGKSRAFFLDGTRVRLQKTKDILSEIPLSRNQYGLRQTPQLLLVAAHCVETGMALRGEYGAFSGEDAASEQALGREALRRLPPKSLVIADRNFGIHSFAADARAQGHEILVRLTSVRAKAFLTAHGNQDGDFETVWQPSEKQAPISGRFIRTTVQTPGFRPLVLYFFTTSARTIAELVELYKRRQDVETDIRSLKTEMGLEMLHSRSIAMLRKELTLCYVAYNLIRHLVAQGAKKLGIPPRQISFAASVGLIESLEYKLLRLEQDPHTVRQWFVKALAQVKIRSRKGRHEPRKIVHPKPKRYLTMRRDRNDEREFALREQKIGK